MDSNFQYAGAVKLVAAPFMPQMLGTGRCALSVFGQHDALRQIGVDATAEAAILAGDDILAAERRMRSATFEAANVRHEHERRVRQNSKIPEQKILMPGVEINSLPPGRIAHGTSAGRSATSAGAAR